MRIKLAILEKDQGYLNRIVNVFNTKYADKFEIYSFTDQNIAMATLDTVRIDVLIAGDAFDIDTDKLPQRCGFAYFVDAPDVSQINDQRAICKFQKADLIYKQILSIYSEKASNIFSVNAGDGSAKVLSFCAVGGGVGASSMAAAAAMHFAATGKKTLYLNLEKFGSSDAFFYGEGQFDMSDIVFAVKSKKTNLPIKLESCVKQDKSGVYFYSQSKIALDMHELTVEDVERLITEIKQLGTYDYIVVDTDFSLGNDAMNILELAQFIVWVSDGTEISNSKMHRAYEALKVLDQGRDVSLAERLCLVYNKFSNKSSQIIEMGIKNIGGAPRYDHASTAEVLEQLSKMEMFDTLI